MWADLGRYLKQLRVAYLLLSLAGALGLGLLLLAGSRPGPRRAVPLTIGGPGPRACAAVTAGAVQPVQFTVARTASVTVPLVVSATRSASARGARGEVRLSATAVEHTALSQTETASARESLRVRTSARVSACAPGRTPAAARARAGGLAARAARAQAQRLLRSRLPGVLSAGRLRAGPQVLARASLLARQALNLRLESARRSALVKAAAAAEQEAMRLARQAAGP